MSQPRAQELAADHRVRRTTSWVLPRQAPTHCNAPRETTRLRSPALGRRRRRMALAPRFDNEERRGCRVGRRHTALTTPAACETPSPDTRRLLQKCALASSTPGSCGGFRTSSTRPSIGHRLARRAVDWSRDPQATAVTIHRRAPGRIRRRSIGRPLPSGPDLNPLLSLWHTLHGSLHRPRRGVRIRFADAHRHGAPGMPRSFCASSSAR